MRAGLLAASFALLAGARAEAAFEDAGFGPRDVAMGGAFCAVSDDPGAVAYNPASIGQASALEAASSYLRQFHIPSGESNRDSTRAAAIVPVRQDIVNGAFGFDARYDRRFGAGGDRAVGVMYGTRGLTETEIGGLDFGGGLKILSSSFDAGGKAQTRAALDLGALWRFSERYALGASALNLGNPKFKSGGLSDRAPLALKIGVAEQIRGVIFAADVTKREPSAGLRGEHTMALGFERWWATPRAGQFALRSGLSLGEASRTWSWGLGWRAQGARLDYAMTAPLAGTARLGHGLSLTVRFGRADPEREYEKLLSNELRYRRQLVSALDAGAVKQRELASELGRLRMEIAALRAEVDRTHVDKERAQLRLKELEIRREKASAAFETLKAERDGAARKTKSSLFEEDWRAYEKAKLSGAPDSILLERVGRLLREYKDADADLSEANRELLRLQRAR